MTIQPDPATAQELVLEWYDRNRRNLPWRTPQGKADPYAVWLSEIMLQQTTVAAVAPYFQKFMTLWPDIHALAGANLDDVLREWAGLGYYARARNLYKCAQYVSGQLDGVFPDNEKALLDLPGVGPYTAAAISAIAFNNRAVAVDGNIERVVARLYAVRGPMPGSKPKIREKAAILAAGVERPGDYTQALMDLGASVCTPRGPKCGICPLKEQCAARHIGIQEDLPARAHKKRKPVTKGVACWIEDGQGHVLLRQRPEEGLLGGMMEFPSSNWTARQSDMDIANALPDVLGAQIEMKALPGVIRHVFTHFTLELKVHRGLAERERVPGGRWVPVDQAEREALPGLMMKVYRHCLKHLDVAPS